MGNSLQDQLKNSGLINDKKAKQLKRAKSKEDKVARKASGKGPAVDERKLELDRKKAEQVERDRKLNFDKNAKEQHKAISAQIKQLIQKNSISLGDDGKGGDKKYSFADGSKIKHMWISQLQVNQLSNGQIAIVKDGDKVALVPLIVAEKIAQRDADAILFKAEKSAEPAADDPYADYQIPDDLDW